MKNCIINLFSISAVKTVAPIPQHVPKQCNEETAVHQIVTVTTQTDGTTNVANQNASSSNGGNLNATQSTSHYNNYNNGVPVPDPSFSTNNQTHSYEQPPPSYSTNCACIHTYALLAN